MADNFLAQPVGGIQKTFGSDEISAVDYPRLKLIHGVDGTNLGDVNPLAGLPIRGTTRISVTPTISTGIYAAKEAVGGLLTFANAVRVSGGSGRVVTAIIVDKDQEMAPMDLVLMNQTFTAPTDNAVFDPTDAELANVVAVIPMSNYADFNDNAVCARAGLDYRFQLTGTSLFGALVSRGTPTFTATTDIIVILCIEQD